MIDRSNTLPSPSPSPRSSPSVQSPLRQPNEPAGSQAKEGDRTQSNDAEQNLARFDAILTSTRLLAKTHAFDAVPATSNADVSSPELEKSAATSRPAPTDRRKKDARSQLANAATVDVAELAAQELKTGGNSSAASQAAMVEASSPESAPTTPGAGVARRGESHSRGSQLPVADATVSNATHSENRGTESQEQQPQNPSASQPQAGSTSEPKVSAAATNRVGASATVTGPGMAMTADTAQQGSEASAESAPSGRVGAIDTATVASNSKALGPKDALAKLGARSPFSLRSVAAEPKDEAVSAQISRAFATALKKGDGTLTIRLAPSNLGDLKISLLKSDQSLIGLIEPSTDVAHRLLTDSVDSLRRSLEAVGVTVDEVRITEPSGASDQSTRATLEAPARHSLSPPSARDEWNSPPPAADRARESTTGSSADGSAGQHGQSQGRGEHGSTPTSAPVADRDEAESPWAYANSAGGVSWIMSPEGSQRVRLGVDAIV